MFVFMKSIRKNLRMQFETLKPFVCQTTFKKQLTVTMTVAILFLATISSTVASYIASQRLENFYRNQGESLTTIFAGQAPLALLYKSQENAETAAASLLAYPDVLHLAIFSTDGTPISLHQAKGSASPSTRMLSKLDAEKSLSGIRIHDANEAWTFVAPVRIGGGDGPDSEFSTSDSPPKEIIGYVEVVIGKSSLRKLVLAVWLSNLVIALALALLTLVVLRFLAGHLLGPLMDLSQAMRLVKQGKAGVRATPNGPLDISEMASIFNDMMVSLETRQAQLKKSRDDALKTALLKTQFAATVSHEIRTPLNSVMGVLQLMNGTEQTPRQKEYIELALRCSGSLVDLVEDVLHLSKMEAGKLQLDDVEFNLRKAVEDVIETLAGQANTKGIGIGYTFSRDTPGAIMGDPTKVRQILLNVVGNAVKFTETGEVAISVSVQRMSDRSGLICFDVTDTGIGIDDTQIERIFDLYAQAEQLSAHKYGGTGLGLAISKNLVELMGGTISASSTVGRGSTFSFTIATDLGRATPDQLDSSLLSGRRILIRSNSQITAAFIQDCLDQHGANCEVHDAHDITAGRFCEAKYDLVISDSELKQHIEAAALMEHSSQPKRLLLCASGDHTSPGDALFLPLRWEQLAARVQREFVIVDEQGRQLAAEEEHTITGGMRVLVADDNASNRVVMMFMLERLGCRPTMVANGREAVDAIAGGSFDVVLMDCSMPVMDGYESSARIRQMEEGSGRRIPIVGLTANTQPGACDRCYAAGMDDYLPKPVKLNDVQDKLKTWRHVSGPMK